MRAGRVCFPSGGWPRLPHADPKISIASGDTEAEEQVSVYTATLLTEMKASGEIADGRAATKISVASGNTEACRLWYQWISCRCSRTKRRRDRPQARAVRSPSLRKKFRKLGRAKLEFKPRRSSASIRTTSAMSRSRRYSVRTGPSHRSEPRACSLGSNRGRGSRTKLSDSVRCAGRAERFREPLKHVG